MCVSVYPSTIRKKNASSQMDFRDAHMLGYNGHQVGGGNGVFRNWGQWSSGVIWENCSNRRSGLTF